MRLRSYPSMWVAVLLLAGCTGLRSNAPDQQLYVLRPPVMPVAETHVEATLQLLRPVAQAGLDSARIALVQPGNRFDYFAGSRWTGTLDQVAGALLAQTLRSSGRFAQVSTDAAGVGADFVLAVTLRRFEADYAVIGMPPRARILLECTLSSRRTHRQVSGFDIETSAEADANRLGSIVAAFEVAAQDAASQLVDRAAKHVSQVLLEQGGSG
jgi:cholesterol transport system auxiliary component